MSATSLSSGAPAADIIDLDHYMRASVRRPHHHHTREHLVVDAGGPERVPVAGSSTDSDRRERRQRQSTGPTGRDKRYSHDSGLSDGSYAKRRHRPHRRIADGHGKLRDSNRKADSNSSVREFKAACEKALQEQQQQIAKVAELCQKLIEPKVLQHTSENQTPRGPDTTLNIPTANNCSNNTSNINYRQNTAPAMSPPMEQSLKYTNEEYQNTKKVTSRPNSTQQKVKTQNFGQNVTEYPGHRRRPVSYTSDVTSSSSGDGRRRDKHRTESCKTYNIIMGKLDELGRLFAARRAPPPSSGSVSVSDKRVATERDKDLASRVVQVVHASGRGRLAVTRAHDVDISPVADASRSGGKDGESIGQWSGSSGSAPDHGQRFDLDDPLHLYAQAKRLQALHATTNGTCDLKENLGEKLGGSPSLCAHCRGWWRAVRRCVRHQLFGGS